MKFFYPSDTDCSAPCPCNLCTTGAKEITKPDDLRFTRTVFQSCNTFRQDRCQNSILCCTHTASRKNNFCSLQFFSLCYKNRFLFKKRNTQLFQCPNMQINGPFSDHTTTRIRNTGILKSSKKTAQQNHRGSHFPSLCKINPGFLYMAAIQYHSMIFVLNFHSQFFHDFCHGMNICNIRTLMQNNFPFMQKSGRHNWQCRIL